MTPAELRAMNDRIEARWRSASASASATVPVRPPRWAASVVDADGALIAFHADTGNPYPLDLHKDLDATDQAVVVGRRILAVGGTAEEVARFVDSFELPGHAAGRLKRLVREAAP